MDDLDRKILTEIQREFPVTHEPFRVLGEKLGLSGEEVLTRIQRLKGEQVLRQISAIFDTRSLGYQSTLVAMKFPPDRLDQGAEIINEHPGVSHNYRRNDEFNLWFTIAVPPHDSLEATIDKLHEISDSLRTLILPTLKLFKIGVKLDLVGDSDGGDRKEDPEEIYDESRRRKDVRKFTERETEAIRALQEDIPLCLTPFEEMARQRGFEEQELFERVEFFKRENYLRRFAGILHHRKAGFAANAMVVWEVPAEKQDEVGHKMALYPQVSHSYKRPVFPDWPYALYTMIHGKKVEDCEKVVAKIVAEVGDYPRKNLYSTKEYKKIRLKYFTEELDNWWLKWSSEATVPSEGGEGDVKAKEGEERT